MSELMGYVDVTGTLIEGSIAILNTAILARREGTSVTPLRVQRMTDTGGTGDGRYEGVK